MEEGRKIESGINGWVGGKKRIRNKVGSGERIESRMHGWVRRKNRIKSTRRLGQENKK